MIFLERFVIWHKKRSALRSYRNALFDARARELLKEFPTPAVYREHVKKIEETHRAKGLTPAEINSTRNEIASLRIDIS